MRIDGATRKRTTVPEASSVMSQENGIACGPTGRGTRGSAGRLDPVRARPLRQPRIRKYGTVALLKRSSHLRLDTLERPRLRAFQAR